VLVRASHESENPRRAHSNRSHAIDRKNWDWAEVSRKSFFSPDAKAVAKWRTIWTRSAARVFDGRDR